MVGNVLRKQLAGRFARSRRREFFDNSAIPTYVIGDVHGRHDLLVELEDKIVRDAARLPGRKLIVMLGDFIDRGPSSARVISRLMAPPPPEFDRVCLTGNHELAMLSYVDDQISLAEWFGMGADVTLHSYGLDAVHLARQYSSQKKLDEFIRASLPQAHITFLRELPILLDTPGTLFVHAGIDPEVAIADQSDEDLVFIRSRFIESSKRLPKLVVHGHTPVKEAQARSLRLNIDTGAFMTGRLTAARLWQGRVHVFST
jgi:serine/threonine protein phosphatase 1